MSEGIDNVAFDGKVEQDGKSTCSDSTPDKMTNTKETDAGYVEEQDGGIQLANGAIQEHSA